MFCDVIKLSDNNKLITYEVKKYFYLNKIEYLNIAYEVKITLLKKLYLTF